jgi:hypothetical protein
MNTDKNETAKPSDILHISLLREGCRLCRWGNWRPPSPAMAAFLVVA